MIRDPRTPEQAAATEKFAAARRAPHPLFIVAECLLLGHHVGDGFSTDDILSQRSGA